MIEAFRKLVGPLQRRVALMLTRAVIQQVDDSQGLQRMQVGSFGDQLQDSIERVQEYGFSSVPLPGAEAIVANLGGHRAMGIVIAVDDRRYRLKGGQPGEICISDDLGQKVHLTRSGIVVDGGGQVITMKNASKVRAEVPRFECTGDIIDDCDSAGLTMADMRTRYDAHTHPGGGAPNPTM